MTRPLSPALRNSLLAAADRLLYDDGIASTGVEAICQAAGVGKPALYRHFGSKDGLVVEYLRQRHLARRTALEHALDAAGPQPRARIDALVDWICEWMRSPEFRGCSFLRALGETASDVGAIVDEARRHKSWVQSLLATELAPLTDDPTALARHLFLLVEGAVVTASYEPDDRAADDLAQLARSLLDAATAQGNAT